MSKKNVLNIVKENKDSMVKVNFFLNGENCNNFFSIGANTESGKLMKEHTYNSIDKIYLIEILNQFTKKVVSDLKIVVLNIN